jgi:hypothetical protein
MAKKNEFQPDRPQSGLLSKLYLTKRQRLSILKWGLYTLLLVLLSVLQDVLLCRMRLFGATTELVPCGILMVCLAEGMERGSIFSLVASCLYLFSGSAAGYHTIVLLTFLCIYLTYFRQSYLRKGFAATMLCTTAGVMAYELIVFIVSVFFGQTRMARIGVAATTGLLTLIAAPVLYPLIRGISTIGGDAWKE